MAARPRPRKVVRATAARAANGIEDEYYEQEPNMKLSHAFMVVLVLHIVAVGGIYAFNKIHATRNAGHAMAEAGKPPAVAAAQPAKPAEPQRMPGDADDPLPSMGGSITPAAAAPVVAATAVPSAPAKVAAKPVVAAAEAAPTAKAAAASDTYKVVKGDNPYSIAKRLGVSQEELLKINAIDDPRKLQIGQVLKVPGKSR